MARTIKMSEAAKLARWRAGTERGDEWVCSYCWSTQAEFGLCIYCRRFEVRRVQPNVQADKPLPPPFPRPFLTFPQLEYKGEQRRRKEQGLPPLKPRTKAQQDIDAGLIPRRPGGALEE